MFSALYPQASAEQAIRIDGTAILFKHFFKCGMICFYAKDPIHKFPMSWGDFRISSVSQQISSLQAAIPLAPTKRRRSSASVRLPDEAFWSENIIWIKV